MSYFLTEILPCVIGGVIGGSVAVGMLILARTPRKTREERRP